MNEDFTLVIADRHPHVRNFLKRELTAEGYRIRLAEKGREAMELIFQPGIRLDVFILDPDLPDIEESNLLKKLQDRIPHLPVVYHTFISEYDAASSILSGSAFIEKGGGSIEELKKVIYDILHRPSTRLRQGNSMPPEPNGAI